MPKKLKLKLNDLAVKSFTTDTPSLKGGDLLTAAPTCNNTGTQVSYCTMIRRICITPYTEGHDDVCKTVKTVDNCHFSEGCF